MHTTTERSNIMTNHPWVWNIGDGGDGDLWERSTLLAMVTENLDGDSDEATRIVDSLPGCDDEAGQLAVALLDATAVETIRANVMAGVWEATDAGHDACLSGALQMAEELRDIVRGLFGAGG